MPETPVRAQKRPVVPRRRLSINAVLDQVFFVVAGLASIWLAYLVLTEGFVSGWAQVWFYLVFWLVLAYLALPRLHRILTSVYVPNYFIGRARTSDGLLGDPVNVAALGSEAQVHSAMRTAGWTRADEVTLASSWRIVTSTVTRRSYDEAPVSPLFLFERKQDFAYQQEVLGNPAKRHHVRFWHCPEGWLLPGGHRADWLAAGTYDRAVGFSLFTLQITHKIEENTDVERDYIVSTVRSADPAVRLHVIEDFSTGYHSRNGGGDTIVTDGDLPILDLRDVAERPDAVAEVAVPVPTPGVSGPGTGAPDKPVTRPAPTVFGALVVLLRALLPFIVVAGILLDWEGSAQRIGLVGMRSEDVGVVLWVLVGFVLAFGVAEFVLAAFVFVGSNAARILVMAFSVISLITAAVEVVTGGAAITLHTNLVDVSLDILILLALSSARARDYARRPREKRR